MRSILLAVLQAATAVTHPLAVCTLDRLESSGVDFADKPGRCDNVAPCRSLIPAVHSLFPCPRRSHNTNFSPK